MSNEYRSSRAVASLILHSRGEPGRPGCVVPPPPTASRHQAPEQNLLWAPRRQLAPRRNEAAALCRPNASLCCHLRSLLVLIDTIGATSPPPTPQTSSLSPTSTHLLAHRRGPAPLMQVETPLDQSASSWGVLTSCGCSSCWISSQIS